MWKLTVNMTVAGGALDDFESPRLLCNGAFHDLVAELAPDNLLDTVDLRPYPLNCYITRSAANTWRKQTTLRLVAASTGLRQQLKLERCNKLCWVKHAYRVFRICMPLLKSRCANIRIRSTIVVHIRRCAELVVIFDDLRHTVSLVDSHNAAKAEAFVIRSELWSSRWQVHCVPADTYSLGWRQHIWRATCTHECDVPRSIPRATGVPFILLQLGLLLQLDLWRLPGSNG